MPTACCVQDINWVRSRYSDSDGIQDVNEKSPDIQTRNFEQSSFRMPPMTFCCCGFFCQNGQGSYRAVGFPQIELIAVRDVAKCRPLSPKITSEYLTNCIQSQKSREI
ncbi:hypothetical protein ACMFMG_010889 [Clarireedia jacksonii]